MAENSPLVTALERLRMAHQAFRRASDEEVRELESLRLEAVRSQGGPPRLVAEIQLRVMERAFDILQLGRFANAPENHGWMNLFRQWGNEEPVVQFYPELSRRFSPMFRGFFVDYVLGHRLPIDEDPIHHCWLRPEDSSVPGIFMDSGRTEPPVPPGARPGTAGIVDFKGASGPDQAYEKPSGSAESKGSAPNE
jgi:hypothetical protein